MQSPPGDRIVKFPEKSGLLFCGDWLFQIPSRINWNRGNINGCVRERWLDKIRKRFIGRVRFFNIWKRRKGRSRNRKIF